MFKEGLISSIPLMEDQDDQDSLPKSELILSVVSPRSGSIAKDGEKRGERDGTMVITMARYALQRHLG